METTLYHEGHRERMTKKFLNNPDSLLEHELLEILLYSFIPRVDTNPIAHRLIQYFGSVYGVLHAEPKELALIDGVGKKTANSIRILGKLLDSFSEKNFKPDDINFGSFEKVREELRTIFTRTNEERMAVVLLDSKYNKKAIVDFCNHDHYTVEADAPEITRAIAIHKPRFAIIAHNHTSGNVEPSRVDDFGTKKINLLCSIHGVALVDHVIFQGKQAYSYRNTGRLIVIKDSSNLDKLIDGIKD